MRHRFFIFSFLTANCLLTMAQTMDSTQITVLDEVEVRANRPSTFQSTSPTQVLQADDWTKLGASQVSDAVKHFSGVQVKDYGGVGGLKTVSLRSLGANHTGVIYDGVPVSDMQTGQIDLGRFSLNFVDLLSLTIGESDLLLQTAQAQALAGALHITTSQGIAGQARNDGSGGGAGQARNDRSEGIAGQARNDVRAVVNVGSFGLLNPSVMYGRALPNRLSLNIIAEYLTSDGDYPFTQRIGDSLAHRKRTNSDVETIKLEANLNNKFRDGGQLQFKTGFYGSERGLPGSATYHNDYSGERLTHNDVFLQLHAIKPINARLDLLANFKAHYSYIDYTNNPYSGGYTQSKYYQSGVYLNGTLRYKFSKNLSVSWANDVQDDSFKKNLLNPKYRTTWLSALAGQYENQTFTLTAKLLNTYAADEDGAKNMHQEDCHCELDAQSTDNASYQNLSPYIGLSVRPLQNVPMRLRAFYKNSYRLPTFGDLYYGAVPYQLKPESANQIDFGMTVVTSLGEKIPYLSFSGDLYNNRVRNKIVAIPGSSMFTWSMQNYGKVDITGVDLNTTVQIPVPVRVQHAMPLQITVSGTYTYQNALDKTDPESNRYNHQIPYTARHSASGVVGVQTPWLDINYNILYCGQRYFGRVNAPKNRLPAFAEQSVAVQREIKTKHLTLTFTGECKNIFDKQYEVVQNYPMPGRTLLFRLSLRA